MHALTYSDGIKNTLNINLPNCPAKLQYIVRASFTGNLAPDL